MGTTTAILGRHEKEFYCSYSYSRINVRTLAADFRLGHDTGRKHTCLFANGTRARQLGIRPHLSYQSRRNSFRSNLTVSNIFAQPFIC